MFLGVLENVCCDEGGEVEICGFRDLGIGDWEVGRFGWDGVMR